MKYFSRFASLFLMLTLLMMILLPGHADFGDFSSDSDYGGSDYSDSYSDSSSWDYDSGSGSSSSGSGGGGGSVLIVLFLAFVFIKGFGGQLFGKNLTKQSSSGSRSTEQRTAGSGKASWGFQPRQMSDIPVPGYDSRDLRNACCNLYRKMQDAWGAGDMSPLRQDFTPDAYSQYERQLKQKNSRGEHAHCVVHSVSATEKGWNENDHEWMLAVEILANISAWNEDSHGNVISGSKMLDKEMRYAWVLRKPKTETEGIQHCPNCGREVEMNAGTVCPACGAQLTAPGAGWQLSSIQGISQRTL